jgi:hypothetical protein
MRNKVNDASIYARLRVVGLVRYSRGRSSVGAGAGSEAFWNLRNVAVLNCLGLLEHHSIFSSFASDII